MRERASGTPTVALQSTRRAVSRARRATSRAAPDAACRIHALRLVGIASCLCPETLPALRSRRTQILRSCGDRDRRLAVWQGELKRTPDAQSHLRLHKRRAETDRSDIAAQSNHGIDATTARPAKATPGR